MAEMGMGNITREIIRRIKGGGMPVVELRGIASNLLQSASTGMKAGVARAREALQAYKVGRGKVADGPAVSCREKYRARDLEPRRGWREKLRKTLGR